MGNEMNKLKTFMILLVVLLAGMVQGSIAAQSSADAVADEKMKEQLRSEIVAKNVFPGEEKEYIVGYGDILAVNIYGEGDMTVTASTGHPGATGEQQVGREAPRTAGGGVAVRMDGRISLLHVGDVNVVGMTLRQIADYLKKLYATIYSDPNVAAVLIQSNSRRYTVMGEIRTPGVFSLDYPITIVQTIARSGGFSEWANHDITVVRAGDGVKTSAGDGGKNTLDFDYDELVKGKKLDKNIYIKSGDIIIVH